MAGHRAEEAKVEESDENADDKDIGENNDCDEYEDLDFNGVFLPYVAKLNQDGVRDRKIKDVNADFEGRRPNIWFIEEKL